MGWSEKNKAKKFNTNARSIKNLPWGNRGQVLSSDGDSDKMLLVFAGSFSSQSIQMRGLSPLYAYKEISYLRRELVQKKLFQTLLYLEVPVGICEVDVGAGNLSRVIEG